MEVALYIQANLLIVEQKLLVFDIILYILKFSVTFLSKTFKKNKYETLTELYCEKPFHCAPSCNSQTEDDFMVLNFTPSKE